MVLEHSYVVGDILTLWVLLRQICARSDLSSHHSGSLRVAFPMEARPLCILPSALCLLGVSSLALGTGPRIVPADLLDGSFHSCIDRHSVLVGEWVLLCRADTWSSLGCTFPVVLGPVYSVLCPRGCQLCCLQWPLLQFPSLHCSLETLQVVSEQTWVSP